MSSQDVIKAIALGLFLIFVQAFFVRNLVLYDVAFCFLYILVILWLPAEMDSIWVILFAFGIGLFVDMFYNTAGIHAAACTLLGFLRKPILKYVSPSRGMENEIQNSLDELGHQRYLVYITLMVFIHHTVLFFIEAGGLHLVLYTLIKIFCSLVFTVLVIYLISIFSANLSKKNQ
ncbi:hypothetical protein LAG90_12315 [Marinilongibacter aquaticus]|uniref:hypothetical protein n=1 Tax=Marinilongibacter aquaticus TaxID=2975157 RepID=UPI0021BD926C|nr:hypothetical protein [Marinilongibacter aquaticus]UBM57599.1 hypothetical protein LAG90_12315 [Marinilongibacter aquaticus]